MPEDKVTEEDVEKEKRRLKKIMTPDKRVEEQKALHEAKELEKKHVPTAEEELEEMEEFAEESERARKILKPAWYLKKSKKKK